MMNKNIYTDIDTIFDTRIALAYLLDSKNITEFIKSGSYKNRVKDNYNNISYDIFQALYKVRNKKILEFALFSNILANIREQYGISVTDITTVELNSNVVLYLNTYPYDLTVEEQDNISSILIALLPNIKIKILNIKYSEIEPEWIKKNVSCMFMYDGIEWLESKVADTTLITTPLIDIMLVVPLLSNSELSSKKINSELVNNLYKLTSSLIELVVLPANNFTCDI